MPMSGSWTEPVHVKLSGYDDCEGITVYVNGLEVQAALDGEFYTAEVPLSKGKTGSRQPAPGSAGRRLCRT